MYLQILFTACISKIYAHFFLPWTRSCSFSKLHSGILTKSMTSPWRRGLVVSSLPATEEIGAMGREIEARHGIGRRLFKKNNYKTEKHAKSEWIIAFSNHRCTSLQDSNPRPSVHCAFNTRYMYLNAISDVHIQCCTDFSECSLVFKILEAL
jgi:hypothetical protein